MDTTHLQVPCEGVSTAGLRAGQLRQGAHSSLSARYPACRPSQQDWGLCLRPVSPV